MLACLYCLGKGKACSFEPLLAEEPCETDADGDLEEVGTAEATASMSAAVAAHAAGTLEAMEEVQATEEAEGSIVEPSLVPEERNAGDHAEGVSWQLEQLESELMDVTAEGASPAAEEEVARALGESQEGLGASATARAAEPGTVPRQG